MKDLQNEAQSKISKQNEEYMYREILKLIKGKLGMDKDEKETLAARYRENLEGKVVPEHI
jgi:ATP-dependent Lon protease